MGIKFLTTTIGKPLVYWLTGSLLIFLFLPVSLVDMLIEASWHAPHWQCDSLAIPLFTALSFLPFWGIIALIISAILVVPFARNKVAGESIFNLKLGSKPLNWIITIPTFVICSFLLYLVFQHIWIAIIPQTIIADCNGESEPITLIRRAPIFQLLPFYFLTLIIWLLHIRALALSNRLEKD